ncbi:MAG: cation transporter [Proteobacteria bacterium]|nr:cation transporter [Pseudomonadota bacterium]
MKTNRALHGITGFMVRKLIKDYEVTESEEVRARYGYLAGWISVVVNLFLAAIKFGLGTTINSRALIADAFHSLSDVLTSAVVIFGFLAAKKPRDKEHPFGHANAELVASLVMSVLLIIAGVELLQSNVFNLLSWEFNTIRVDWIIIILVLLTIAIKEWLFSVSKNFSLAIDSQVLNTDAWHHRLDSFTTLIVLIGIIFSSFGILWMDSAIGVLVAGVVIWSGVEFAIDSISPLLGENVTSDELQTIHTLIREDSEITNIHDIIVHKYGKTLFISLHVEILSKRTPVQMHDIATAAADRVMSVFGGTCTVHVDPVDLDNVRYQEVASVLHKLVEAKSQLIDFHDLQFRQEQDGKEKIQWEFSIDPNISEKTYPHLKTELAFYLENIWLDSSLHFSLEPGFNILTNRI